MNTHPTNQYLTPERLTDLAQFAVPDGHDLWPKIERAARTSATRMSAPRPGLLSLGFSRAWTAVGVLFIAATFAALGFGLAVLVLSNGHNKIPAAPVTPTPTAPTASPTPIPPIPQASANTPPLYVPDYPRDLDHIRETLGSVYVPTYVPDGYQLTQAEVNINELRRLVVWVEHEASLTYSDGLRGIDRTAIGEFSILQFPEGWDPTRLNPDFGEVSAFNPEFEESTVGGLKIWQDPELESPGFHFQVDGRWLWISVFGAPNDTIDLNELVKVAKSVKRFGEGDPIDWLAVSGITRHGFRNTALSDLNEFVDGQSDEIHISIYLPGDFGLESLWRSQDSDGNSITLEFVLPSYLKDGKRLERVTLSTSSHPTQYRDQVDVGGTTGYVFRGTSSSDVTLVFQYDGRWYELVGHPATDLSVLDELIKMAESLQPYVPSHQRAPTPVTTGATPAPTTPDSWVSENGFIQFTTGALEDLFDVPLPGTHQWCTHPSNAPKEPAGPWLAPTKLPDGMEQAIRDQMVPQTMVRAFRSSHDRITMEQGLCAVRKLNPAMYRAIQIGDRIAYVTAGRGQPAGGSAPAFDPNDARSLIMDIGHGTVEFNVFGSVTVDDLVAMAASLVPEELTGAEQGPYPQAVLDELGTGFGPVYVPGELPDGYEMFGQLQARQEALGPRTARLSYVRVLDGYCVFRLNQAGLRRQFPNVVERAQRGDETSYTTTDESGQTIRATAKWGTVEIDGVTIYAQEFSAQPRNEYTDVYFQSQGVWFNLTISTSPYCNHTQEMVAEIATSLEPLQP